MPERQRRDRQVFKVRKQKQDEQRKFQDKWKDSFYLFYPSVLNLQTNLHLFQMKQLGVPSENGASSESFPPGSKLRKQHSLQLHFVKVLFTGQHEESQRHVASFLVSVWRLMWSNWKCIGCVVLFLRDDLFICRNVHLCGWLVYCCKSGFALPMWITDPCYEMFISQILFSTKQIEINREELLLNLTNAALLLFDTNSKCWSS